MIGKKICSLCHEEKPLEDFYANKNSSDGRRSECKVCHNAKHHEYYLKNIDRYREMHALYHLKNRERDIERHREWGQTERGKQSRKRYLELHREQRNEYYAKYRKENREKIRERNRKFYKEHKDVVDKWNKKFRESHPNYSTKYYKHRQETDQIFKLKQQIRHNIYTAFKRKGEMKNSTTEEIVGCPLQKLYDHLLSTWEKNYGKPWSGEACHIDHILPLALADTEEDIVELCHYTNLQLLTPEDNHRKSAKL